MKPPAKGEQHARAGGGEWEGVRGGVAEPCE